MRVHECKVCETTASRRAAGASTTAALEVLHRASAFSLWPVVGATVLFLVGALSNILVFLGEEREWMRVDREGENEPR